MEKFIYILFLISLSKLCYCQFGQIAVCPQEKYENDNSYLAFDYFVQEQLSMTNKNALEFTLINDEYIITNRINSGLGGFKVSIKFKANLEIIGVDFDKWDDVESDYISYSTVESIIFSTNKFPTDSVGLIGHYSLFIKEDFFYGETYEERQEIDTSFYHTFNGKFKFYSELEREKGKDLSEDQSSSISGKVSFAKNGEILDSIEVAIFNSTDSLIKSTITDKLGFYEFESLVKGIYYLQTGSVGLYSSRVIGIDLEEKRNLTIDLKIKGPCIEDKTNGICPICKSKKNALQISPNTIVSYNFGQDKRKYDRFDRKLKKKGYEVSKNNEGKEIVISVFIESEQDKFWNCSYHWFCTRDKFVF